MHPVLFEISWLSLEVRSYPVALALAVVVCFWLGPRWAQRTEGIDPRTTRSVLVWLGLAAFAGGRLHFLANLATQPLLSPSLGAFGLLRVWDGLHAGGAILALVIALPLVVRLHGLSVARVADALVPTIGVGIALARTGCFLNGCCYGVPCHGPWCVVFPAESYPHTFQMASGVIPVGSAESAPVHPIQLYWVAAALAATVTASLVHGCKGYAGRSALVWCAVYLVLAAAAEPFRAGHYPQTYVWWGRLQFEWIAAAMAVAAVAALAVAEIAARRSGRRAGAEVGEGYAIS